MADPKFRNIKDCLYFHLKMVTMILLETLLIDTNAIRRNEKF